MRETKILEASGEADAILKIQEANATGIKMLNEAAPTKEIVALKGLEAFVQASNGNATKIIIIVSNMYKTIFHHG